MGARLFILALVLILGAVNGCDGGTGDSGGGHGWDTWEDSGGDVGGSGPADLVEPSDMDGPSWGAAAQMIHDSRVLVAGGAGYQDGCTDWAGLGCISGVMDTAVTYDPATGQFTSVGSGDAQRMTEARAFAAAVELPSGEIAIFGGVGGDGEAMSSVEIFDPFSGTFSPGPPMQFTRAWHTATLFSNIGDGFILVSGGFGSGADKYEIWNKSEGTVGSGLLNDGARWRHTATLIQGFKDSRDKIVIAGGEDSAGVKSTYEIFDLSLQTPAFDLAAYDLCISEAEKAQGLPAKAKTMHAAALVPEQKFLYIAGGFSDSAHAQPTSDICVWSATDEDFINIDNFKLQVPRGGLTATTLPGNMVLLAGGLTGNNATAATYETIFEYLGGGGNKVIDVGPPVPLATGRWDHAAVPLSEDGEVLLLGGIRSQQGEYQAVTEAELVNPGAE